VWIGSFGSKQGPNIGFCEYGNETLRSISLVVGKMFSSILAGRLIKWLINHKMLGKFQAGFVQGKRNTDNIFVRT
jgi:hypothetical protein